MFKRKILKNKKLFWLLIIYALSNIFLYNNNFYHNFLKPLFWISFLIIFYYQNSKWLKKKEINITLIISIAFFIIYFFSGFIFGFNKSPYDHTLISILKNLGKVILPIVGLEIIRYKLIKSNQNYFGFRALITIIIIVSEINFKALFLSHNIIFLHYLFSIIIPIIAKNILFTYLSLNSHYDIPIIIKFFDEVPKFLLPIIPYSNWFTLGAFALIKVLIIYYLFKYFIFKPKTIKHVTKLSKILYPTTIMAAIILVLFMLGFFNYQPIAILSNSMNPTFKRGDVVIYKNTENILPGDIIVFKYESQIIVHRVVSVSEYYVTRGDANNTVDYMKIKKEDIKGVYQFHIKYLGYPAIWLNEFFTKEN